MLLLPRRKDSIPDLRDRPDSTDEVRSPAKDELSLSWEAAAFRFGKGLLRKGETEKKISRNIYIKTVLQIYTDAHAYNKTLLSTTKVIQIGNNKYD